MAAVLGVSANYHDAAAALVVDGQVVAAMQEERFSRIKNDASLPLRAIAACLQLGRIDARSLDAVVFYENPYEKLERILLHSLRSFPRALSSFSRAMATQLGGKLWVLDALASELGVERRKVHAQEHHRSHAASAYYLSPFAKSAVLTVDGVGEHASTAIFRAHGSELTCTDVIAFPHSLGLLYAALTAYLGFEVNEGESKVMGLAAFGEARFLPEFERLVKTSADGSFTLGLAYFDAHTDSELGFGPKLEQLLGPRRAIGKPWALDLDVEDRRFADIAATLQAVTERVLLGLAERARRSAGCPALCLAGGVALNAVANARLAAQGPTFVQPAAGDAGGALGAAILHALSLGDARPAPLTSAALGLRVDVDEALLLARALGLHVSPVSQPSEEAARRIARGEIVGFVEGRFEWGPRALGQRSLLALPRAPQMRERLNRVIKRREPFRPFAPAVLASRVGDWFGAHAPLLTPFMTSVAQVRSDKQAELGAVTHVDGSARLQTVSEATPFGLLLAQLERESGSPVVLNTSLNGQGQPIVASAADALYFLLTHRIDGVMIEDLWVTRP